MNQPTEPKADKSGVRRHNLSLVLRTVHDAGETTRAAVAARVGLTRPAVSSLVEQLLDLGFLVESGKTFSGQAGRPGTVLKPADTGPAGLGVEINVDYVTVCVVDLTGTDRVRRTERLDNRAVGAPEVLARAARIAAEALDTAAERQLVPAAAGLALPGLVSDGAVRQAPNLGWYEVDAERLFGEALTALRPGTRGLALTSDNEANMAALAELWFGALGDLRTFLHLTGEIGVGGAIVVHGELLRGAHGFAGEIGHLVVDAEGPAAAAAHAAASNSTRGRRRSSARRRRPESRSWRSAPPRATGGPSTRSPRRAGCSGAPSRAPSTSSTPRRSSSAGSTRS